MSYLLPALSVPQLAMLQACASHMTGGPFPVDVISKRYPHTPKSEIVSRQRSLEQQGLLKGWALTSEGLRALLELENA